MVSVRVGHRGFERWGRGRAEGLTIRSVELGSEHLQLAVARLLRVLDAVAEVIQLRLHAEPTFLVIDRTAEIADQPVHFVLVK